MAEDPIYQLVYVSKATQRMSMRDTMQIVETAEPHNDGAGVTGVLCFGGGYFLQLLEGGAQDVSDTFMRICRDERHSEICLIDFSLVRSRTFGEWSMHLINLDAPDHPTMEHRPDQFAGDSTHPFFSTDPRVVYSLLYDLRLQMKKKRHAAP